MKEWNLNMHYPLSISKNLIGRSRNDTKLKISNKIIGFLTGSTLTRYSSKNKMLGYYTTSNSNINVIKQDTLKPSNFFPRTEQKKNAIQKIKSPNLDEINKVKKKNIYNKDKEIIINKNPFEKSRNKTPLAGINKLRFEDFYNANHKPLINEQITNDNFTNNNKSNISSSLDASASILEKKKDVKTNTQLNDFMSPRSIKELKELNDKLTIKPKESDQKFKIYPSNNIKYKFDSKFRLVLESIKRK